MSGEYEILTSESESEDNSVPSFEAAREKFENASQPSTGSSSGKSNNAQSDAPVIPAPDVLSPASLNEDDKNSERVISGLITLQEEDKTIFAQWPDNPPGHSHKIQIVDGKEIYNREVAAANFVIDKREFGLRNGSIFYMHVTVVSQHGDTIKLYDTDYVVGGDTVAVSAFARLHVVKSHDTVEVIWNHARTKPIQYEVILHNKLDDQPVKTVKVQGNKATFRDLKENTTYYCMVTPIYDLNEKGKSATTKDIKTLQASRNLPLARNVQAHLDARNPTRWVNAKWDPPDRGNTLYYECGLYHKKNARNIVDVQKVQTTEAQFQRLKSDKAYYIGVRAVFTGGERSNVVFSPSVSTNPAFRKKVDLNIVGKPKITSCAFKHMGDKLYSDFSWAIANLGDEANNYDITVSAQVKKKDWEDMKVLDNGKTEPTELAWGRKHTFGVTCTYRDLDSKKKSRVEATQDFETMIEEPQNLSLECDGNEITCQWSIAKGATSYAAKLYDTYSRELVESNVCTLTKAQFKMTTLYPHGKRYTLIVEAHGKVKQSSRASQEFLIGGDFVATHVKLLKDETNSSRKLLAKWKPPVEKPEKYEIELHEMQPNALTGVTSESVQKQTTDMTFAHFAELKSSTTYFLTVLPIFTTGASDHCSASNFTKTAKRISDPNEEAGRFGTPANLLHTIQRYLGKKVEASIAWSPVQSGSNHKLLGYELAVEAQSSWLHPTTWRQNKVFSSDFPPDVTTVDINTLESGNTYEVKLTTKLKNLDTLKTISKTKTLKFHTKPSTTEIYDCTWKGGIITFMWAPVEGAKSYTLIVKELLSEDDLHFSEISAKKVGEDVGMSGPCRKRVAMGEKLGIGTTCRVKVRVVAEGDLESETDWRTQLIGGKNVPRNVKASLYPQDPCRAIKITFDQPEEGSPNSYKVIAKPTQGREKKLFFQRKDVVFENLRSGTGYKFEVHAVYGEIATEPCISNMCQTQRLDGGSKPAVEYSGTSGNMNFTGATISNRVSNLSIAKGPDFGKVRNLGAEVKDNGDNDMAKVQWKVPAFDHHPKDYRVYYYLVEIIRMGAGKVKEINKPYVKGEFTYETEEFPLEMGETYTISVTTHYEDIDQDTDHTSSAETLTVYARPGKPVMLPPTYANDSIKFEWNHAKGATNYIIEIVDVDSEASIFKTSTEKKTSMEREFGDKLGYGTCFRVIITAYGSGNKTNVFKSSAETIGGSHVPRNAQGTIKDSRIKDPNTEVFLSWQEPKLKPISYEVAAIPACVTLKAQFEKDDDNSCIVSGLKAGTYYYFKVFAKHKDRVTGKEIKSGGCRTERIQTNPTPTQVKNVKDVGKPSSTSVKVKWDPVMAVKENDQIQYRVTLTSKDGARKLEMYVEVNHLQVYGLDPGQTYSVTVAGKNSDGFGRDSDNVEIQTEFGTPKSVYLIHDESSPTSPSTGLLLKFESAEGEPTGHFASLVKLTETEQKDVVDLRKVEKGYLFKDLEPNTKYMAVIHAVYGKEEGEHVNSKIAITAPAKAAFSKSSCCIVDDANSADTFELEWKPAHGCDVHEVVIECGNTTERTLVVKDDHKYIHLCKHPMWEYSAKIRSRNESGYFGEWSHEALIHLGPEAVKDLKAEREGNSDLIKIKCQKLSRDPTCYFMQPICDGSVEGSVLTKNAMDCQDGVEFTYTPLQKSKQYTFSVWAKISHKKGRHMQSNAVTSRPDRGVITELIRCDQNPSTDIKIGWTAQERCHAYEISIQQQEKDEPEHLMRFKDKAACMYRCLSPGAQYAVSIRCFCQDTCGPWSELKKIDLAPAEVQLNETDADGLCNSVSVNWEKLDIRPTGYVAILYCDNKDIDRYKGPDTKHNFTKTIKPGYQCYCTVAAYKVVGKEKEEIVGKPVKSKIYKIKWAKPRYLHVTPDENEPSKRAKITWDKPYGVNCFRLEIENKQNGVTTTLHTKEQEHLFESGVPANSYKVRLYCGCDSRFDSEFKEEEMIMRPIPPSDIKVNANAIAKGLEVHFQDDSISEKKYKITAEPLSEDGEQTSKTVTKTSHVFRNLVDGESYRVSVKVLLGDVSSKEAFYDDYVQTFPGAIWNLRSRFENGSIIYEWDEPNFKPNEYRVQWRCNDDPVTEEATEETNFVKVHPLPGKFYKIRVYAVNNSGSGPMSKWETFITDPSPVHSIEGYANPKCPETSLIIKFQDSNSDFKSYRVTATSTMEGDEPKVEATDCHYAIINGLVPGAAHSIEVVTLFCGKESKPAVLMDI